MCYNKNKEPSSPSPDRGSSFAPFREQHPQYILYRDTTIHNTVEIGVSSCTDGSRGLCSSSSCKYSGTEGTIQNRHWNHHRWHATDSLEWTRLSCWCLQNHKGCTYRAPVRYVPKTWSIVLLNKKKHILLSQVYCVWRVVKTPTIISNNPVFFI